LTCWNWGGLSDHGELGPTLHKMPLAQVRNGLICAGSTVSRTPPACPDQRTSTNLPDRSGSGEFRT
jgi:hypothetical protein